MTEMPASAVTIVVTGWELAGIMGTYTVTVVGVIMWINSKLNSFLPASRYEQRHIELEERVRQLWAVLEERVRKLEIHDARRRNGDE